MARHVWVAAVGAVFALAACGNQQKVVTLRAPEDRVLNGREARAGSAVLCVTHGEAIKGRVPVTGTGTGSASVAADYDGEHGGSLSIEAKRGQLVIRCS